MSSDPELQQLEEKLSALDAERAKLIVEINNLRNASTSNASQTFPKLNEEAVETVLYLNFI